MRWVGKVAEAVARENGNTENEKKILTWKYLERPLEFPAP
jgi:hypothetical protein